MSSPQPPQPPKTLLGQLTQAVQTIHAKVNFSALTLKPNARVPELWVQDAGADKAEVYPLIGDRYFLGRSSKSCDIVVRNPVISQIHLSLERYGRRRRSFLIKDENSTNGIYRGKRRLPSLVLRHGDVLTLGPPELAAAVRLQYVDPPPWYILAIRYVLYGIGGLTALIALIIGIEWIKVPVIPLPVGVQGPVIVQSADQTPLRQPRTTVHRELGRLSEFSPYLPKALIASEDSRYYWHFGVDPIGILRALVINLQGGEIRQGASTLTQQVARSLFPEYVGRDNTAGRKLREAAVALKLETFYSKDQILKTYLNRIYLGETFGFEDGAQFYFEKSAKDLTLSEAATLVAMLPAPNRYNPVQDYDTALKLRNRVITRMRSLGMINDEEAQRARRSRIDVSPKAREFLTSTKAPYFYSYVFDELRDLLGEDLAQEGNFIVETGLNLQTQAKAQTALQSKVATDGARLGFDQGAIVTLDTRNGEIRALTGGVDYAQSQFNRATQAQRQPGSTFKLFDYAAALEQGIPASQTFSCAPAYGLRGCERSGGNINMYTAFAQSENVVAVRVAQAAGMDNVVQIARRLGVRSKLDPVPRLAIGQSEVNVLEITGSYAAIANNGVWNRPHAIRRILDSSDCTDNNNPQTCRVIYSFDENGEKGIQAVSPGVADTMNTLLRGVVQGGTGGSASIGFGEAGKTGTTDRNVDLWFIGYVPSRQLATGIWLGNDKNTPTSGSSAVAAQLWSSYMRGVVQ
ncbi:MAG: transglycosylase domain-containing protein [Symplocastrum torsivum CPER-KK1]|jgi:membrane peptidoglycan carboxypeptidase|uniref:Transglycosylase domain-containing protein n=1 Tax=Symplocastrum torsivum CPER-KK1 TaxID=450513 RepID=A0A951PSW7_9CYAN|nr:transglycosylase domain-containing protein [Symplocastrum torsivum CPER-KK1]